MKFSVLSPSQVEQFVYAGYTVVRNAFSRTVASEVRKCIWQKIGLNPEDPSGWKKPVVHLCENFGNKPFTEAFTPKIIGAFDDVMGEDRWEKAFHLGWWPVAFPGFDKEPWQEPTEGWHIDGSFFHHHLDSKEQGLLPIFIFSDIEKHGGATVVSEGSHLITARVLAEAEPKGLSMDELTKRVLSYPNCRKTVIEATGNAGDVVLIHPFLLHARSPNCGPHVRFICNPCFSLKENMNLKREVREGYSPVELAIVNALRY